MNWWAWWFQLWPGIIICLLPLFSTIVISLPSQSSVNIADYQSENNNDHHRIKSNRERRFLFSPSSSSSLSSSAASALSSSQMNDIIDETKLPLLYIGEVDLTNHPDCNRWLEPSLFECQHRYENHIYRKISERYELFHRRNQLSDIHHYYHTTTTSSSSAKKKDKKEFKFQISRNDEYIKQASCCGMWHARDCVIRRIIEQSSSSLQLPDDCPKNLIELYQRLPNEPSVRESVLDYCSEYSDGSSICRQISSSSESFHHCPQLFIIFSSIIIWWYYYYNHNHRFIIII